MRDIKVIISELERALKKPLEEISVVSLVELFVEAAYVSRASDVHIHPDEGGTRIRFRVDGVLRDIIDAKLIDNNLIQEIITRIKVITGLRTDEHLSPQDGRFKAKIEGLGGVDVRVSIMPTYYGENAVLRVLAESQDFKLEDLEFNAEDHKRVLRAISKPYGMILANGPTGSGKTTTLYTILKKLNSPDTSIITIEDPIEYSLSGTTQIQANNKTGLTFANGLRSILRQDPNTIMVGEIRDEETAGIAVNAALTGHLVLSTLHTNDSATTFPRLVDMGVPPFLVASTINVAMGQRLLRRICDSCKKEKKLTTKELESLGELIPKAIEEKPTFFEGKGCKECNDSGYSGRVSIREVLEVTHEIRELVMSRANAQQIKKAAVAAGMKTMLDNGYDKALNGLTTIEEVLRIIHE